MGNQAAIQHLRLLIGENQARTFDRFCSPGMEAGVPKGALVELIGTHKAEWLIELILKNPELRVHWAQKSPGLLPTRLFQRGIDHRRVTFAYFGDAPYKPLRAVIQSQLYPILAAPNVFDDLKIFRALQRLTEKANATLFLLGRDEPNPAWPIGMQLKVSKGTKPNDFAIRVLKNKYGE